MTIFSLAGRMFAAFVITTGLAGCATFGSTGLVASTVTAKLTPEAAAVIAGDMVGRLAEQIGPGNTTIALAADGSVFDQALEASLKGWGYAVVTDQQTKGTTTVPLAYVVDQDGGSVLVRLSTASFDITRMFTIGADGATPSSPVSVMQHGSETSS